MHKVYNTPGKCNQNISNETGKTKYWENKMNSYFGSFFFWFHLMYTKENLYNYFQGFKKY